MKKVFVVTEGRSETNFVKRVLVPYFITFDKNLIPVNVITKKDDRTGRIFKGGLSCFNLADKTIKPTLKMAAKTPNTFVTTMFDLYGLPKDTPGFKEANQKTNPYEKVAYIETALQNFENPSRPIFFPYIQLHEFEALIFCDIQKLEEEYFDFDLKPLNDCLQHYSNPELINNGSETAPSKRIISCIKIYDKATSGVSVLEKIGIENLCQKCKHFSEWIEKLKSL